MSEVYGRDKSVLCGTSWPLLQDPGQQLDNESFRTLMKEVQAIVNLRPLTTASSEDLEVLTPNHLLTMTSKVLMPPPGVFLKADLYCRKRWRRVQQWIWEEMEKRISTDTSSKEEMEQAQPKHQGRCHRHCQRRQPTKKRLEACPCATGSSKRRWFSSKGTSCLSHHTTGQQRKATVRRQLPGPPGTEACCTSVNASQQIRNEHFISFII